MKILFVEDDEEASAYLALREHGAWVDVVIHDQDGFRNRD